MVAAGARRGRGGGDLVSSKIQYTQKSLASLETSLSHADNCARASYLDRLARAFCGESGLTVTTFQNIPLKL